MTYIYALATLLPTFKHSRSIIYSNTFKPAIKGHRLVYVRQAFLLPIFCFILFINAHAQSAGERADAGLTDIKPLLVGQKVPEDFWKREHLFYIDGDTVRKDLSEYKGKLLILDFWATWCGPCLKGFKKLEDLQTIYGDKCGVIPINSLSTRDDINKISSVLRDSRGKYWGKEIPTIILDEYLDGLFPHIGVPYIVWLNDKGTVYALTRPSLLESNIIFNLISRP